MKVKKFDNLFTMGLILCGAILVLFYIAKIFFPQFIVGVAEIPSIVAFGEYVDTHKWAYIFFNMGVNYFGSYILFCACCRKKFLKGKDNLILLFFVVSARLVSEFLPQHYSSYNYVALIGFPFLMNLIDKNLTKETFISTVVCFCVDISSQILSVEIRNLFLLSTHINVATMTILLIDGMIWRTLLYLFFNHKNNKGV